MSKQAYGEFSWEFKRVKGKLYAVINRNGKLYRELELWQGGVLGKCSANTQVRESVEYWVALESENNKPAFATEQIAKRLQTPFVIKSPKSTIIWHC